LEEEHARSYSRTCRNLQDTSSSCTRSSKIFQDLPGSSKNFQELDKMLNLLGYIYLPEHCTTLFWVNVPSSFPTLGISWRTALGLLYHKQ
jgi:hypothetical protein